MPGPEGYRLKNPAHIGTIIKNELIEERGLSVTDAASVLGVSRQALSSLLNARARLSPDMAVRLEKAFGFKMDSLLRMQNAYDIAQARKREPKIQVKKWLAGSIPGKLS